MVVDIHSLWTMQTVFDDKTGEVKHHGLINTLGLDGAARELKKRCEAEAAHGNPLVGCSMYLQQVVGWTKLQLGKGDTKKLDRSDKNIRELGYSGFRSVGEKEIMQLIEDTWEKYPEGPPDDVVADVVDIVTDHLEDRYGSIAKTPSLLTPDDIRESKEIALSLGKRKPRKIGEVPTAARGEVKIEVPDELEKLRQLRAEIDAKIKETG